MFKNFWQNLKRKIRQKEINSYAKGLIFSMRAAIFNAKSKNPQMEFNSLVRLAIPLYSKSWRLLESRDNYDLFIYKDLEKIKIEKNVDFTDVLTTIADTEIRSMYFGVINKNYMNIKDSGQFMSQGLGESEMIEKIIREEIKKYFKDDLQNWRTKK